MTLEIMLCIHHYSMKKHSFTILKVPLPFSPPSTLFIFPYLYTHLLATISQLSISGVAF